MSEDHRVIKKLREDAASNPLAWLFAHDALELLVYVDRLRAENQRLNEAVRSYVNHHLLNLKSPGQIQRDLLAICGDKHMHVAGIGDTCAICHRDLRDDVHTRGGE